MWLNNNHPADIGSAIKGIKKEFPGLSKSDPAISKVYSMWRRNNQPVPLSQRTATQAEREIASGARPLSTTEKFMVQTTPGQKQRIETIKKAEHLGEGYQPTEMSSFDTLMNLLFMVAPLGEAGKALAPKLGKPAQVVQAVGEKVAKVPGTKGIAGRAGYRAVTGGAEFTALQPIFAIPTLAQQGPKAYIDQMIGGLQQANINNPLILGAFLKTVPAGILDVLNKRKVGTPVTAEEIEAAKNIHKAVKEYVKKAEPVEATPEPTPATPAVVAPNPEVAAARARIQANRANVEAEPVTPAVEPAQPPAVKPTPTTPEPVKPVEAKAGAKEPWEMKSDEFAKGVDSYHEMRTVLGDTPYKAEGDYSGMSLEQAKAIQEIESRKSIDSAMWNKAYNEVQDELLQKYPEYATEIKYAQVERTADTHQLLVEKALREGKRVPDSVVDEFLANGGKLPESGLHQEIQSNYAPTAAKPVPTPAVAAPAKPNVEVAPTPRVKTRFTDAADAARKRLSEIESEAKRNMPEAAKRKPGQLGAVRKMTKEEFDLHVIIAADHIARGVKTVAELAKVMATEGYKFSKAQVDTIWEASHKVARSGGGANVSIKNATMAEKSKTLGLGELPQPKKVTAQERSQQASQLVKSGKVTGKALVDELEQNMRPLDKIEDAVVHEYQTRLEEQLAKARESHGNDSPEITALVKEFDRARRIYKATGTEQARALQARSVTTTPETLDQWLAKGRDNQGDAFNSSRQDKVITLHERLESGMAKEKSLEQQIRQPNKPMVAKSPADFKTGTWGANNSTITVAMRDAARARRYAKMTSQLGSIPDPTIIADLAIEIGFHVEAGVKFTTAAIKAYLKEEFAASDKDVDAALAIVRKQVATERSLERSIAGKEAKLSGESKPVSEKPELITTPKIEALKAESTRLSEQIKAIKTAEQEARKAARDAENAVLAAQKAKAKHVADIEKQGLKATQRELATETRQIATQSRMLSEKEIEARKYARQIKGMETRATNIKAQIARGMPKEKAEPIRWTNEWVKVHQENVKLRMQLDNITSPNKSLTHKLWDVALGVPNSLMGIWSGFDDSFLGRQGLSLLYRNPKAWLKGWPVSLKAMFSERNTYTIHTAITEDPRFAKAQQMGVRYQSPDDIPMTGAVEENVRYLKFAERIPLAGRLVRPWERAYTTAANYIRHETAYAIIDAFGDRLSVADGKAWGRHINILSGYGDLGRLSSWAPSLRGLFVSARKMAADVQRLTTLFDPNVPSFIKKDMAKVLAREAAAITTIALLINNSPWGKRKEIEVGLDMDSPDFLQFRVGNTRFPMTSGEAQVLRTTFKLWKYSASYTRWGTHKYGSPQAHDALLQFLSSKQAGGLGVASRFITKTDFMGRPTTDKETLRQMITPWNLEGVREAFVGEGAGVAALATATQFVGIGANTYADTPKNPKKTTLGKPSVPTPASFKRSLMRGLRP
jgi:hypothetical protein